MFLEHIRTVAQQLPHTSRTQLTFQNKFYTIHDIKCKYNGRQPVRPTPIYAGCSLDNIMPYISPPPHDCRTGRSTPFTPRYTHWCCPLVCRFVFDFLFTSSILSSYVCRYDDCFKQHVDLWGGECKLFKSDDISFLCFHRRILFLGDKPLERR